MTIKGIQFTERDKSIVQYIQRFPLSTSEHIHCEVFPNSSYSATARRMKKLCDSKLINRHSISGQTNYRYTVTKKTCDLLQIPYKAIKKLQPNHLQHDIELYDCLRGIHQKFGQEAVIYPDFELRQYAKRNYRQTFKYKGVIQSSELRFLPDALLQIGTSRCFLEWDRNTIHGINLHKKLLAYYLFFEELRLRKKQFNKLNYHIFFICPSEHRAHMIKKRLGQYPDMQASVRATIQDEQQIHDYIQSLNNQEIKQNSPLKPISKYTALVTEVFNS